MTGRKLEAVKPGIYYCEKCGLCSNPILRISEEIHICFDCIDDVRALYELGEVER